MVIGALRGRVIDREPVVDRAALPEVLLDVGGIGYRVLVTSAALAKLPLDTEVVLHIHHHIREGDQRLYGFLAKEERVAFQGLLAAHGVGPALAMAVLATHPAARLARVLADDDLAALCEVPGVGKKTAQRMLVELKSTLKLPEPATQGAVIDLADGGASPGRSAVADVREALVNLGYTGDEVRQALSALPEDVAGVDSGQLLKTALRAMVGGR
jgi:Holliday junction DNA helicase RuvA